MRFNPHISGYKTVSMAVCSDIIKDPEEPAQRFALIADASASIPNGVRIHTGRNLFHGWDKVVSGGNGGVILEDSW